MWTNNQYVGLACAMKNAGVGVGIPDTGRCRLVVEDGKVHIFAGASCIGQGLGTVLTQMVYEQSGIPRDRWSTSGPTPTALRIPAPPPAPARRFHRRGLPPGLPGPVEALKRKTPCQSLERAGVLRGIPGQDGPAGSRCAQPRQPHRLRLRHPDVRSSTKGGTIRPDRGGPRRGQGGEPPFGGRPDPKAVWSCPWGLP